MNSRYLFLKMLRETMPVGCRVGGGGRYPKCCLSIRKIPKSRFLQNDRTSIACNFLTDKPVSYKYATRLNFRTFNIVGHLICAWRTKWITNGGNAYCQLDQVYIYQGLLKKQALTICMWFFVFTNRKHCID